MKYVVLLSGRPAGTRATALGACRAAEKLQRRHPRSVVRVCQKEPRRR